MFKCRRQCRRRIGNPVKIRNGTAAVSVRPAQNLPSKTRAAGDGAAAGASQMTCLHEVSRSAASIAVSVNTQKHGCGVLRDTAACCFF